MVGWRFLTRINYRLKMKKGLEQIKHHLEIILSFLIENTPEKKLPNADGIFVFGHIDPRLAHHVSKLWKMGKAPYIIITGKGKRDIPRGFDTEASYYASLIKKYGVPMEALILEDQSTNSLENVVFGMKACNIKEFFPKTLILCAIPPLLRRSCATFHKQFPELTVYGSAFTIPTNEYLTLSRVQRILEEFDRFDKYSKKGDIQPIKVPDNVINTVQQIKTILA